MRWFIAFIHEILKSLISSLLKLEVVFEGNLYDIVNLSFEFEKLSCKLDRILQILLIFDYFGPFLCYVDL